jgi:hypothetical protein
VEVWEETVGTYGTEEDVRKRPREASHNAAEAVDQQAQITFYEPVM